MVHTHLSMGMAYGIGMRRAITPGLRSSSKSTFNACHVHTPIVPSGGLVPATRARTTFAFSA